MKYTIKSFKYFLTNNILLKNGNGLYETNKFQDYWAICAELIYKPIEAQETDITSYRRICFESSPFILSQVKKEELDMWIENCKEYFKNMQEHLDIKNMSVFKETIQLPL